MANSVSWPTLRAFTSDLDKFQIGNWTQTETVGEYMYLPWPWTVQKKTDMSLITQIKVCQILSTHNSTPILFDWTEDLVRN